MTEQMDLTMEEINDRIKREYCANTVSELSDEHLMSQYKECASVKNAIGELEQILSARLDESESKQKKISEIVDDYLLKLIPPGTKGVIRGNQFNHIVKRFIHQLPLDGERFEICFEKKCMAHFTTEIPDWYILEKSTNRILIGMNQLDLWGGGQQLNRGSKYIENNKHNNEHSKLLCVVCNMIQFTSKKSKAYKLFEIGFRNNTLCYLNHLYPIIGSYFHIL